MQERDWKWSGKNSHDIMLGYPDWTKSKETHTNSRWQKGNIKKLPYWGHTNISHHSDMAPQICAPLMKRSNSGMQLKGCNNAWALP